MVEAAMGFERAPSRGPRCGRRSSRCPPTTTGLATRRRGASTRTKRFCSAMRRAPGRGRCGFRWPRACLRPRQHAGRPSRGERHRRGGPRPPHRAPAGPRRRERREGRASRYPPREGRTQAQKPGSPGRPRSSRVSEARSICAAKASDVVRSPARASSIWLPPATRAAPRARRARQSWPSPPR